MIFPERQPPPNNPLWQKLVMGLQGIPAALLHSMKRRYCIENGESAAYVIVRGFCLSDSFLRRKK